MKLRNYQDYAVNAVFEYFKENVGNPLIVMPTGTGKSLVIAEFCRKAITEYRGTKIMMLTHVKELIEQNHLKLLQVWPTAPAGIYSSGLGKKDMFYPITFGGVASVAKADLTLFGKVSILLIDEAHLVSPNEETMYRTIITKLKEINPALKVVGLTATDFRLGMGRLAGPDNLFTDVCVDMSKKESFNWFIKQGYLVPLIPRRPNMTVDISGVKLRGGEFVDKDAQAAMDKHAITYKACTELVGLAASNNRKHWLIFGQGVDHVVHIYEMLLSMNISACFVHSKVSDAHRDEAVEGFKSGKYTALVNNGILTTGFDYPALDLIAMLRLTMSSSLWVQMLGRGTRPDYAEGYDLSTQEGRLAAIAASEKQNCLVLDFAANTRRLGPINDPVIPQPKGKGSGDAPVKVCEECFAYNHASVRFCEHCNAEFPRHYKVQTKAASDELIAGDAPIAVNEVFEVSSVTYKIHQRAGKIPTLRVSYTCALRTFTEYICIEHGGFAGKRARDWWRYASADDFYPKSVEEAIASIDVLRKPKRIRVWLNKEYPEIVNYEYQ